MRFSRRARAASWLIGMAGVCVVALVDSLALVAPAARLLDPVMLAWLVGFGVFGAALVLAGRRLSNSTPAEDVPPEAPLPDPGP